MRSRFGRLRVRDAREHVRAGHPWAEVEPVVRVLRKDAQQPEYIPAGRVAVAAGRERHGPRDPRGEVERVEIGYVGPGLRAEPRVLRPAAERASRAFYEGNMP